MKQKIISFLSRRTAAYINKKRPIIVAVVGSVGKTSTTQAIAGLLGRSMAVRKTKGSYNGQIGVVLSVFDESIKTNPLAWIGLVVRVMLKSTFSSPKEAVYVLELSPETASGMDGHAYLAPDLTVVTAVTPEHMEYYADLDAVAAEELKVARFSKELLINADMVDKRYITKHCSNTEHKTYSLKRAADFRGKVEVLPRGMRVALKGSSIDIDAVEVPLVGEHSAYMLIAAAVVADRLGIDAASIAEGLAQVRPVAGRMQLLDGKSGGLIIDDTYNASPEAVKAALDTLGNFKANRRIALLGNMNELGTHSEELHKEIGAYIDKTKIDLVVTLGPDANKYLAAEAERRGVNILRTTSPVEAGKLIAAQLGAGTVVLAKGSQNRVYAEEAVKLLLENPDDADRLVRQTGYWLPLKRKQFPEIA